jgi:glycosyltransferase involved in cell wall biosynthesis
MRLLFFEPDHTGHHLAYIRRFLPTALELADEVVLAIGQDAPQSAEFAAHLGSLPPRLQVDAWLPPMRSGLGATWNRFLQFREAIRRARPDYVYAPYADGLSQMLGMAARFKLPTLPKGIEAEGLLMRGSYAYPPTSRAAAMMGEVSYRALRTAPWARTHFIDPLIFDYIQRRGGRLAERSRLLPDPAEPLIVSDRHAARRALGVPEQGRYLALPGGINERKGAHLLLSAFAKADLGKDDHLLLLGPQSDLIRGLMAGEFAPLVRAGKIIAADRYVREEEFDWILGAADVICAPYPRHIGSASIVIRAAASGRPVLASNFGWNGYVVPRFGLGSMVEVTDIPAFAAALADSVNRAADFRLPPIGERFVRFHTPENFVACWFARLRERLGKPAERLPLTWNWLLEG